MAAALAIGVSAALLALAALPSSTVRGRLGRLAPDGEMEALTPSVLLTGRIGLIALALVLAVAGFVGWRRRARLAAAAGAAWREMAGSLRLEALRWRRLPRRELGALIAICALGLILRLCFLDGPMRHDEAKTYLSFISLPLFDGISNYYVPNNHVFYTALAHGAVRLFGDGPPAIRMVAFVCGCLMLPLVYWLGRRLFGRRTALLATAWAAIAIPLIDFSTDARGYTLICALTLSAFALLAGREQMPLAWLALAVAGAFALWAVPTAVFPIGVILTWAVLDPRLPTFAAWRRRLGAASLTGLVCLSLAAILYTPAFIRSGVAMVVANKWVLSLRPAEFWEQLPDWLGRFAVWAAGGAGWKLALIATLGAVALWPRGRERWLASPALRLVAAGVLATAFLLVARRVLPPERILLALVPLLLLLAARGLSRLLRPGSVPLVAIALALAGSAWALTLGLASQQECPEAEALAATIADPIAPPGATVLTATPAAGPLRYYLRRRGWPLDRLHWIAEPEQGRRLLEADPGALLVVRHGAFGAQALGAAPGVELETLQEGNFCALLRVAPGRRGALELR